MSRFGKSQEDRLLYKCTKLEKANEEMVKRINEELLPAAKQSSENAEMFRRVAILSLVELGGAVQLTEDAINDVYCDLAVDINPETKIITVSIKNKPEEKAV